MTEICCRALYDYDGVGGEKITTLEFEAGEIIKVVFSGDSGWWEGEKNGNRGWFPASYVKRIRDADATTRDTDKWKRVSTEAGETYYVNMRTYATSWKRPKSFEPASNHVSNETNETPANASTNNTASSNGKMHFSLPLTKNVGQLHSVTLPESPGNQQKDLSPTSPHSKSLPITPDKPSSPVLIRSKRASTTSNTTSNGGSLNLKPRIRMVNGISFPDGMEAKEQTLLHPGKFSYCDYFWGDKFDNHNFQSGFFMLFQKMLNGKQMCKEMSDLVKAREAVEIQYAKGLASIASSILAEQEEGTLGETLKQVKAATLQESKVHQDFAFRLREEVAQPLLDQKDKEKKELKKLETGLSELRKQVQLKYQAAEKSKQMMLERTKDFETKLNSSKHTKEHVQRARRKSTKHAEDLSHSVEMYNKHRQLWFEEMVTSSLALEKHEAMRINTVKALLSRYIRLMLDTNDRCNKTCDVVHKFINETDADKDRETWVRRNATGKVKPVDLVI